MRSCLLDLEVELQQVNSPASKITREFNQIMELHQVQEKL